METKIVIPNWLRKESPITAGFCELINSALIDNPKMSLADFAQNLSEVNVENTIERMKKAEEKQFGGNKQWQK